MYNLKLGKKLRPAGKVWKGFTSKLQAKLLRLKRLKALRSTSKKLNTSLLSLVGRPLRTSPQPKRRNLASTRPLASLRTSRRRQIRCKFASVYVDDLFTEPVSPPAWSKTSCDKGAGASGAATHCKEKPMKELELPISSREGDKEETTAGCSADHVLGSPRELVGVDARAERFIAEFRREMSLQRQRSFKEYQEMLQRGAM